VTIVTRLFILVHIAFVYIVRHRLPSKSRQVFLPYMMNRPFQTTPAIRYSLYLLPSCISSGRLLFVSSKHHPPTTCNRFHLVPRPNSPRLLLHQPDDLPLSLHFLPTQNQTSPRSHSLRNLLPHLLRTPCSVYLPSYPPLSLMVHPLKLTTMRWTGRLRTFPRSSNTN